MAKPVRRGGNIYTYPFTRKDSRSHSLTESASSKNIANKYGYNRRIRGPVSKVTTTYIHVDTPDCLHCKEQQ